MEISGNGPEDKDGGTFNGIRKILIPCHSRKSGSPESPEKTGFRLCRNDDPEPLMTFPEIRNLTRSDQWKWEPKKR
jgi:hypothetical protein